MKDFCFLDLETTGFDPYKDSIIEISFVRYQDGEILHEVDQVCVPDKSTLTDFVSNLTGITQQEIDTKGVLFQAIAPQIEEKIGDSAIIGHNIDFDINFLIANGINIKNNPRIDTHELARILLPAEESYALEVLSQKHGFPHENAHRAMSDVLASKDLFELLLERIETLPTAFLSNIQPVLRDKSHWHAKEFFLQAQGTEAESSEKDTSLPEAPSGEQKISIPKKAEVHLIRIGNNQKSADFLAAIPGQYPDQKFVIITPKLNYFPYFKQFPTPEVLFDADRFYSWASGQESLDNTETTFYLKCAYRNYLGHRGKQFFDIFTFKEPPLWDQVCAKDHEASIFKEICKERRETQTLVMTPYAFFRFLDLSIFQDRTLIFDEGEICAESLLFAGTETFSFRPYLDDENDHISTEAQFIVTDFCRNVMEEQLQQNLGRFPTKMLLPQGQTFTRIPDRIRALSQDLEPLADILENPTDGLRRWVAYYPETGNLVFHTWSPEAWKQIKQKLSTFAQIWTSRDKEPTSFFQKLVSEHSPAPVEIEAITPRHHLTIPSNLTSATSPDFNASCAQKILEIFSAQCSTPGDHLAVYVSSVEALRQIHEILGEGLKDQDAFVIGEKASGGDGKVLELLKNNQEKKGIFLFQKIQAPALEALQPKAIIVQKFPFNPPHPLFQDPSLEAELGVNWWEDRVIPQVTANLLRAIGQFSTSEIILIDPRENASWGKEIIRRAFE